MSQYNLPDFASPQPGSTFLKDNLEPWRDAVHSGHMGNTRPDYVIPGMWWIDNTSTPWVAKVFQGSDDIIVGSLDPTTLVFIPSGVEVPIAEDISYDDTGNTYVTGADVQAALDSVDTALTEKTDIEQSAIMGFRVPIIIDAADTEHDRTVSSNLVPDDTGAVLMRLSAALTKQADVTFAEGNNQGGMVSGESLPTSGTIHFWQIMKADGTVDVCINNHASSGLSPTLPTGFIYKRRIGSRLTDGSANISLVVQDGAQCMYNIPFSSLTADYNASGNRAKAALSCNLPQGVRVQGIFSALVSGASGDSSATCIIYDGENTDIEQQFRMYASNGFKGIRQTMQQFTNTSGQIQLAIAGSPSAAGSCDFYTLGWIDDIFA